MSFNNALPKDFILNEEFKKIFDYIENTNESAFVTGPAGSGKTTCLNYIRANTSKYEVVLAPTGVAAVNLSAQTVHSFFQFPWGLIDKNDIRRKWRLRDLFRDIHTLIIDEISMVRVDMMDGIDYSLRANTGIDKPFGGIQVIMFGDLYQLPPVIKEKELYQYFEQQYGGHFFFHAPVFDKIKPKCFELSTMYRQTDKNFIELLGRIRHNEATDKDLVTLNQRVNKFAGDDRRIPHLILTTTNSLADYLNNQRLAEIWEKEYEFQATIKGVFDMKSYPTAARLKLKKGAQVMLIRNDKNKQWVNGSLGTVADIGSDYIKVLIEGNIYEISPEIWEKSEYITNCGRIERRIIGTFEQFPIKLGWAVTIHKSQGLSLDNVIIDLGNGAFTHGQVYTALTRCRTLEGISLREPIGYKDIILDKKACGYKERFQQRFQQVTVLNDYFVNSYPLR